MNKKEIIEKIVSDLPTHDMRGEMSDNDWISWFEEAYDKGANETINMVPCQSHKCHMCCPVGDEFCPKEPCLIKRKVVISLSNQKINLTNANSTKP